MTLPFSLARDPRSLRADGYLILRQTARVSFFKKLYAPPPTFLRWWCCSEPLKRTGGFPLVSPSFFALSYSLTREVVFLASSEIPPPASDFLSYRYQTPLPLRRFSPDAVTWGDLFFSFLRRRGSFFDEKGVPILFPAVGHVLPSACRLSEVLTRGASTVLFGRPFFWSCATRSFLAQLRSTESPLSLFFSDAPFPVVINCL